jgi:hypothetical protein
VSCGGALFLPEMAPIFRARLLGKSNSDSIPGAVMRTDKVLFRVLHDTVHFFPWHSIEPPFSSLRVNAGGHGEVRVSNEPTFVSMQLKARYRYDWDSLLPATPYRTKALGETTYATAYSSACGEFTFGEDIFRKSRSRPSPASWYSSRGSC